MGKPVIGVTPLYDKNRESSWMIPGYLNGILKAGGIPVIIPNEIKKEELIELDKRLDGYLFTGGPDVDPSLYQQDKSDLCGDLDSNRDYLEPLLYKLAYEQDKPVLGICRGIQLINVLHGGTLYQDLQTEHPSFVNHRMKSPYNRHEHLVTVCEDSPLYDLLKHQYLGVNSCHHQAINQLGEGLQVMAYSPDNLVEAIYVPNKKFIWAVQWHPEFIFEDDRNHELIFKEFINSIKK